MIKQLDPNLLKINCGSTALIIFIIPNASSADLVVVSPGEGGELDLLQGVRVVLTRIHIPESEKKVYKMA